MLSILTFLSLVRVLMDPDRNIIAELRLVEVPTVEQLLVVFEIFSRCSPFVVFSTKVFDKVMLRWSRAPRRFCREGFCEVLDVDIVQLSVRPSERRKGHATGLFQVLSTAAAQKGRGVFLEQCITDDSRHFAKYLVANNLAVPMPYNPDSFLSRCYLCD